MPGGENLGASFAIDITDLKAGLAQANRLIRQSESAFQEAAAGMDDWTESAEGLQKRVDSLSDQVEIQKEKVAALVKEKQNIIDKMTAEGKSNEEIEKAVDGVNKAIEREGKQLSRMQGNLKKSQKALDNFSDTADDAADGTEDLGDEAGDAVKPLKKLKDTIEDQEKKLEELNEEYANAVLEQGKSSKSAKALKKQINSLSKDLDGNKKKLDKVSDSSDDVGDSFSGLKKTGAIAAGAIAAVAAAGAAVVTGFLGLAESTRESRDNMAKLETSFQSAGLSAEDASDTYTKLYGVLGDDGQATEAAQHIAKMAGSQEDLSKWTNIATGVYATFGDSLPIESLTEAANETAKTGAVTGSLADALNWSTMSTDDWNSALSGNEKAQKAFQRATKKGATAEEAFNEALSKCSTEQERQSLITSVLNGMYGDAAEAYRTTNAEVIAAQEAQANYNAKLAELGEKAEPITTAVTNGFASILEAIIGLLDGADFEAIASGISSAFSNFVDNVIPAIVNGFTWIKDNWTYIEAGIAAVGAAFAAFQVVTLIQNVTNALKGMSIAQAALNFVMSMNPIGLVVAAIAGLVAAFVVLWNKCDGFREFWIGLWEAVKSAASTAWEAIKGFFSDAWEAISGIWSTFDTWMSEKFGAAWEAVKLAFSPIVEWFTTQWENIKLIFSAVESVFKGDFEAAWTAIKGVFENWATFFTDRWNDITTAFSSVATWFSELFASAWTNITTAFSTAATWASGVWTSITTAFGDVAGNIGGWFTSAYTNITSAFSGISEWASGIWTTISGAFSGAWDTFVGIGGDIVNGMVSGVEGLIESAKEKVTGFFTGIVDGVKSFLGIHSPSTVFAGIGGDMAAGVGVGFDDSMGDAETTMTDALSSAGDVTAEEAVSAVNAGILANIGALSGGISAIVNAVLSGLAGQSATMNSIGSSMSAGIAAGVGSGVAYFSAQIPKIVQTITTSLTASATKFKTAGSDIDKRIAEGMVAGVASLTTQAKNVASAIVTAFEGYYDDFKSVGSNMCKGIWDGFANMKGWLDTKVTSYMRSLVKKVKAEMDINSPSRVFAEIGANMARGLGVGFGSEIGAVNEEIRRSMQYGDVGAGGSGSAANSGLASGKNGGQTIVVNQTNNFSQAHSRVELYRTKQQTAAAVRLATGGAVVG